MVGLASRLRRSYISFWKTSSLGALVLQMLDRVHIKNMQIVRRVSRVSCRAKIIGVVTLLKTFLWQWGSYPRLVILLFCLHLFFEWISYEWISIKSWCLLLDRGCLPLYSLWSTIKQYPGRRKNAPLQIIIVSVFHTNLITPWSQTQRCLLVPSGPILNGYFLYYTSCIILKLVSPAWCFSTKWGQDPFLDESSPLPLFVVHSYFEEGIDTTDLETDLLIQWFVHRVLYRRGFCVSPMSACCHRKRRNIWLMSIFSIKKNSSHM